MPKFKKNLNPQVFLEISIDGRPTERITFELFADVVPKTAENFRALCTGEKGLGQSTKKPLYFKGTHIHRIIPGFMAQGGDFSRGDGRGGESIYGGKFQDENFKLKHDQPGILSMANSGEDSNGSQFFMTFKAVPHLDGKHVVFGKMLNGKALLKKLEGLGSESGKPTSLVKIVDCGEVSNIDTQNQLHGEKEKKLKRAVEDNSDTGGRVKTKKPSSVDKRRKKGKNYSSDSCSSETSDSQSYSSDSGSDSESYSSASSDTSSSSDHRHKRRKGSKKVKRKPAKRKSSHKKSKSKSKSRGTKKSKRSYGRSSDDSKSSSSSSDNESAGCRTNHLLKKDAENSKTINLEIGKSLEYTDKGKQTVAGSKPLHKDENGADERVIIQNSEDRSNKFRDDTNPIRADTTLSRADGNITAVAAGTGMSGAGAERNPLSNEPVPTTGQDLAVGSTEDGRVRKGRGFTQKYSFARRYRTPSPECSHLRSSYNGGRNDRWNNFNRYGRNGPYGVRSPVRRYHGSPRAGSPPRYTRRDQSRSRSHSPVRCRDGGRRHRRPSPRRSRSPSEQHKRDVAYRPRSGHGGGGGPSASRGRSGSRSKNRDASRSRSPDDAPSKRVSSKYNRRGSSSSISSSPSGSKGGLVSY